MQQDIYQAIQRLNTSEHDYIYLKTKSAFFFPVVFIPFLIQPLYKFNHLQ